MYILAIVADRVVVTSAAGTREIASVQDFDDYMTDEAARLHCAVGDLPLFVSSTIEFPIDFTNNPDTIALAKALCATQA